MTGGKYGGTPGNPEFIYNNDVWEMKKAEEQAQAQAEEYRILFFVFQPQAKCILPEANRFFIGVLNADNLLPFI